jgi:hypothetical protein
MLGLAKQSTGHVPGRLNGRTGEGGPTTPSDRPEAQRGSHRNTADGVAVVLRVVPQ